MKKKIYVAAIAVALLATVPVTSLATIEGQVKTGDFSNSGQQVAPLIGDFKEPLTDLANSMLDGAKLLEQATQSFTDCELRSGRKEIDQARYSECILESAQEVRNAELQLKSDFEKIHNQIGRYQSHLRQVGEESRQALQEERNRIRESQRQMGKAVTLLEDLIKKIQGAKPNEKVSLKQKRLQEEISDLCYHVLRMKEIYQYNIARLEEDISQYQYYESAAGNVQYKVERGIRQVNYHRIEADEFIRSVRLYGFNRARQIEARKFFDLFNDSPMSQIPTILKNIPNYSSAMAQLGKGSKIHKPHLPEPQTNGEMLSQLQALLNQMKGGISDE